MNCTRDRSSKCVFFKYCTVHTRKSWTVCKNKFQSSIASTIHVPVRVLNELEHFLSRCFYKKSTIQEFEPCTICKYTFRRTVAIIVLIPVGVLKIHEQFHDKNGARHDYDYNANCRLFVWKPFPQTIGNVIYVSISLSNVSSQDVSLIPKGTWLERGLWTISRKRLSTNDLEYASHACCHARCTRQACMARYILF